MRFVIDSRCFDGTCITSMRDDTHSDYGGETLDELCEREHNAHLIAVTPRRISLLLDRYYKALARPFMEISEERYYDLLDCVPPKRQCRNRFFVGEAYSGTMYDLCFTVDGRYFKALRQITLSDEELEKEINSFSKKLTVHPTVVKGEASREFSSWRNREVCYMPYYVGRDDKRFFICNLLSDTGRDFEERRLRGEMAGYLIDLRRNRYDYFTFYSHKKDIFEFFGWLREKRYTLEIHGELFDIDFQRSYADFHGNVLEYSAAFHYRIYSRELFENIIYQLRRVKRHFAWRRNPDK